jgi:hypothetical protein
MKEYSLSDMDKESFSVHYVQEYEEDLEMFEPAKCNTLCHS